MLLGPRLYALSQVPDKGQRRAARSTTLLGQATSWQDSLAAQRHIEKMLLVHQTGSVRVGEVVRYTLTYTPSEDRILPAPKSLHVKIKNTSAIPLRAAYLHGPYTLHVSAHPSSFHPNRKLEHPEQDGVPEYEPQLKAGGSWGAQLMVPARVVEAADNGEPSTRSVTWILEIACQVIFSSSAVVHFELLVGRDEMSVDLGFARVVGMGHQGAGQLEDHQQGGDGKRDRHAAQPKGVFSKAIKLVVEDTASLWNTPAFPRWDERDVGHGLDERCPHQECSGQSNEGGRCKHMTALAEESRPPRASSSKSRKKPKKVHLVILTHGLHSNLGADMLYLKEAIDEGARQARVDARKRRAATRKQSASSQSHNMGSSSSADKPPLSDSPDTVPVEDNGEDDEEDEQVIVRGFADNVVKTEKGIKYLGKRLAKYVLRLTYPQQPYLVKKKSPTRTLSNTFTGQTSKNERTSSDAHSHSTIYKAGSPETETGHQITSISFIGHSLGGLVQTYAVAYIQKHSPEFFELIEPINFVALATPFLGLSNENPLYVKFALDFGLVGRTGKDLGLTWRAPTLARSGWGAVVGGLGSGTTKAVGGDEEDPEAKPLLRILPTGPAHRALKRFRNRTVYSNVVNDGIVPLRTSCLLFLDWSGLGRVEKARRENGLIGTMAGWGWTELTGQNSALRRAGSPFREGTDHLRESTEDGTNSHVDSSDEAAVPQPARTATNEDTRETIRDGHSLRQANVGHSEILDDRRGRQAYLSPGPWRTILNVFRLPHRSPSPSRSHKTSKVYKRSQTLKFDDSDAEAAMTTTDQMPSAATNGSAEASTAPQTGRRPGMARGDSVISDLAPPTTTVFEAAGDILSPPLPPLEFLIDPTSRARTIFHDRVYHPEDIPPPPLKRAKSIKRSSSLSLSSDHLPTPTTPSGDSTASVASVDSSSPGAMKVEEKIARAYHRDLSWRKVLVRLEPDAHNNIIVRRRFANAYGWPVIKHVVDTHFADGGVAALRDDEESGRERAKGIDVGVGQRGEEVDTIVGEEEAQSKAAAERKSMPARTDSEIWEARDGVGELSASMSGGVSISSGSQYL